MPPRPPLLGPSLHPTPGEPVGFPVRTASKSAEDAFRGLQAGQEWVEEGLGPQAHDPPPLRQTVQGHKPAVGLRKGCNSGSTGGSWSKE